MGAAAMTIGAILRERTGAVISARPNDAVRAVVDLLAQNRIGAVPVLEGDAVVGIFSERDIVRLLSSYGPEALDRSEEHTSELQSLMRISYAVFCLKKKKAYRISLYLNHTFLTTPP